MNMSAAEVDRLSIVFETMNSVTVVESNASSLDEPEVKTGGSKTKKKEKKAGKEEVKTRTQPLRVSGNLFWGGRGVAEPL